MSEHAEQTEKAFQKQENIFAGAKRALKSKDDKTKRYFKNVGLGFKTPKEAIEGTYVDKKCPWTGNVSIVSRPHDRRTSVSVVSDVKMCFGCVI